MGTVQQKLAYTKSSITDAYNAVISKGGTLTLTSPLASLKDGINSIPTGSKDSLLFSINSKSVGESAGTFNFYTSCKNNFTMSSTLAGVTLNGSATLNLTGPNILPITVAYPANTTDATRQFKVNGTEGSNTVSLDVTQKLESVSFSIKITVARWDGGIDSVMSDVIVKQFGTTNQVITNNNGECTISGRGIPGKTQITIEPADPNQGPPSAFTLTPNINKNILFRLFALNINGWPNNGLLFNGEYNTRFNAHMPDGYLADPTTHTWVRTGEDSLTRINKTSFVGITEYWPKANNIDTMIKQITNGNTNIDERIGDNTIIARFTDANNIQYNAYGPGNGNNNILIKSDLSYDALNYPYMFFENPYGVYLYEVGF